MVESDFTFVPLSDVSLNDKELIEQHNNYANGGSYTEAVNLLDNNNFQKGFRASIFNTLRTRLQTIAVYLLNLTAEPDELYSLTEPTLEEMGDKKYWIQPFT